MPFAAAQIGTGFRNEISPRQGLLRVREFTMGEIEHFYDPQNTSHPKFDSIADMKLPLFSADDQENGVKSAKLELTMREALEAKVLKSETLSYFLARSYLFLTGVGIRPEAIRFRQHRANEMAHYANDCWDAEVETSYGWVEVAGHSDRSAFDLTKHQQKTRIELMAARPLKTPITVTHTHAIINKPVLGKEFKKD
jgi:glycyl-tRNA synthetase